MDTDVFCAWCLKSVDLYWALWSVKLIILYVPKIIPKRNSVTISVKICTAFTCVLWRYDCTLHLVWCQRRQNYTALNLYLYLLTITTNSVTGVSESRAGVTEEELPTPESPRSSSPHTMPAARMWTNGEITLICIAKSLLMGVSVLACQAWLRPMFGRILSKMSQILW